MKKNYIIRGIFWGVGILLGIIICNCRDVIEWVVIHGGDMFDLWQCLVASLSLLSIYLLYRQIKGEHEKARREKAVDLLQSWTLGIKAETHSAKKIVDKFTKDQCRKLQKEEKFKVKSSLYKNIETIIPRKAGKKKENYKKKGKKKIRLTKYQVHQLRYFIVSYLNLLESILVAWQKGVVDEEIIEEQFSFIMNPIEDKNCLEDFRTAAGSEVSYPAIEMFYNTLEEKRKQKLKKREKIE